MYGCSIPTDNRNAERVDTVSEEKKIDTIDAYIAQFDGEKRERMEALRRLIHEAAPYVEERMSWRMPTFYLYGNLVHFAANKAHIGFYPGENGVAMFQAQLAPYKTSKGAIQFPMNQPLPYDLVREIVTFRVAENALAAERKLTKGT